MRVVGTAGHVDHGKSTLVRTLTGVDPDRWAEEKARGLTIDLGFAAMTLPSGGDVGFVDVPGHGRFIRNMLAGAGSVDACLFVVAATEGWKEQSEEHLRILELLGVSHGVVALSKVGLVDEEWAELAEMDTRDHLAGTFLAGSEVVRVDAPTGRGVTDVVSALDRLVSTTPAAADVGRPRLWIDRSFALRGSGTVVTGTLTGGRLGIEEEVVVLPGGLHGRIRSLQSHHRPFAEADPGRRLAVNLNGPAHRQLHRGQALVRPGQWHLAPCFDASLKVLSSLGHPVGRRGAYSFHVGSADVPVRMRVLGAGRIEPGEEAPVRLWVQDRPGLPLVPGDRFVLREAGRDESVGGGTVLDVDPVVPAARAAPSLSTGRLIRERGWVEAGHLERISGRRMEATVGRWVVDPEVLGRSRAALVERCRAAGPAGVGLAAFDERERAVIGAGIPGVAVRGGRAVAADLAGPGLTEAARRVLAGLESGKWSPPAFGRPDVAALRELERAGMAVEAGGLWFAATAVESAAAALRALLDRRSGGFTVSEARDALGSSRKHVLPLLSHLDATGVTRRRGDLRVAGPRLAGSAGGRRQGGTAGCPSGGATDGRSDDEQATSR